MHLLITAGGTREYIDPVRFISNASSGRMGLALARAALRGGHTVTLILAPTPLRPPTQVHVVPVIGAAQMFDAVKAHFDRCDALIMAAAVADYTPARPRKTKLKKDTAVRMLALKRTADILAWAGRHKQDRIVVGFALEDRDVLAQADQKRLAKRVDLIVANTPEAIGASRSAIWVRTAGEDWTHLTGTKDRLARAILRRVEWLVEG